MGVLVQVLAILLTNQLHVNTPGKASEGNSGPWATHIEDPEWNLWFWPDLDLNITVIWGVNKQMKNPSFSFIVCVCVSLSLSNK